MEPLRVIPLHKHPEYIDACCEMINEEWPRSRTARMMSLSASCDKLPTSLILIDCYYKILGHAKLTPLPTIPNSCFLETVVIAKNMRGKKLGTYLMKKVEEYCKNILNLEMLHLSTKGQEIFYTKLGYTLCSPVSIYGNPIITTVHTNNTNKSSSFIGNNIPPPPPMPKLQNIASANIKSNKTFMFKYL